ncbi:hypothetical protein GCM10023081_17410 [Arthrobacter ginkgonis]|uniref:Uncharacterized protein n=1 Tax=Arthrobacter ginkgonis TaxID=1630594 RepID=A0ABP7C7F5_9MICC
MRRCGCGAAAGQQQGGDKGKGGQERFFHGTPGAGDPGCVQAWRFGFPLSLDDGGRPPAGAPGTEPLETRVDVGGVVDLGGVGEMGVDQFAPPAERLLTEDGRWPRLLLGERVGLHWWRTVRRPG